ncbi:MAG TPA: WecB/TagA/CpsF family glycosyltransferase [Firmicutes bacterium]|nr:WecB/TagA/CpsF family glycosyltransferase [Bacillota bacterium]
MKSNILGVKIDNVTMQEAVNKVAEMIQEPKPHLVVTANSEMVMIANRDPLLNEIIERADLVVPDSIGVIWASRILKQPLPERVPGIELMQALLAESVVRSWRIFLLGAEPGIAEQAAKVIAAEYKGINIVGTHHGFFTAAELPGVLDQIKKSRPDILFIALGVPKQEKFAAAHLANLGVPVALGVGGSFQVLAGAVRRAPYWMRRVGLEWLYRIIRQPARIGRAAVLPQFALWVLLERLLSGGKT